MVNYRPWGEQRRQKEKIKINLQNGNTIGPEVQGQTNFEIHKWASHRSGVRKLNKSTEK